MIRKYKIGQNRLAQGYKEGFGVLTSSISGDNKSVLSFRYDADSEFEIGRIFLKSLDKGVRELGSPEIPWGRLSFKVNDRDRFNENFVYSVSVLALNDKEVMFDGNLININEFLCNGEIPSDYKKRFFEENNASVFANCSDILLYEQSGRYLFILIEARGNEPAEFNSEFNKTSGEASNNLDVLEFWDFCVYAPGDNFFNAFPEVYRKNGEFFRRYISIFSSLYNDLQEKIDDISSLLDLETAPYEVLMIFADWLGLELSGAPCELSEERLRKLVKAAFGLIKYKGTLKSIREIVKIFVDEPFYIAEQRFAAETNYACAEKSFKKLYGNDEFCFTVFINRKADETLRSELLFLIDGFKPLRTRARIVFLGDIYALDEGCFLDVNAIIPKTETGTLDRRFSLNGLSVML